MTRKWLYSDGISDRAMVAVQSAGADPSPQRVEAAASALGRPVRLVDGAGYQCEIFAAAINEQAGLIAFVETKARQRFFSSNVDIEISLHIRAADGRTASWPIASYNPYFGCNARYLEWWGQTVLFIYREKHDTYACRFGLQQPAAWRIIGDYWRIVDSVLASRQHEEDPTVARLSLPELTELKALSAAEAETAGMLPVEASLLPTRFWEQHRSRQA